jgi:hypothetical protein
MENSSPSAVSPSSPGTGAIGECLSVRALRFGTGFGTPRFARPELAQASMISSQNPTETEERMRRLNFLDDEPWDEVEDDKRVRSIRARKASR